MRFAGRMREANEACYAVVRTELRTLFGALCKNKSADLTFSGAKVRVIYVVFLMSSTISASVGVETSFLHGIARPLVKRVAVRAMLWASDNAKRSVSVLAPCPFTQIESRSE